MSPHARMPARVGLSVGVLVLACAVALALASWGARWAEGDAAVLLANAGPLTTAGLPLVAATGAILASAVVGGLVLAGWILPEDAWGQRVRVRVLAASTALAVVWVVIALAHLLLSYSLSSGQALTSPRFGSDIGVYMVTDLGVWRLWAVILAAATSAIALAGSSRRIARASAFSALLAVMARAMTGHAAGNTSHESATSSMFLHLVALGVWVGPLVYLALFSHNDSPSSRHALGVTIRRYSAWALGAWLLMAYSGTFALVSRIERAEDLFTHPYGQLALVKIVVLLVLGVCGLMQRRVIAAGARNAVDAFRRIALLELLLMGVAIGGGAAMGSSPPPGENIPPPSSPAGILTSYELPPDPLAWTWLTQWREDVFALALAAVALSFAVMYRQRLGRRWPLVWGPILSYLVLMNGPLAVYSYVLFSAHFVLALALMFAVGLPLGVAWGARAAIHGARIQYAADVAMALVPAVVLSSGYLVAGVIRRILESHPAHVAWTLVCIAAGVLIGRLVASHRAPHSRIVASIPGISVGLLGVYLALTERVIAASWFGSTARTWFADALADQQRVGVFTIMVGAALAVALPAWHTRVTSQKGAAPYIGEQARRRDP